MEFNEHWTKQDNDLMRQMIKEGKSPKQIVEFFGEEKIKKHPRHRYSTVGDKPDLSNLKKYVDYVNEMYVKGEKTKYTIESETSTINHNFDDYILKFKTNSGSEYIINLFYIEDSLSPFPNNPMYNISFTLAENYNLSNWLEYEKLTKKNEEIELMKRLMYIILKFDEYLSAYVKNVVYIIGETDDDRKIKFYRNIIHDSLPDYEEVYGDTSINGDKKVYYYYKK